MIDRGTTVLAICTFLRENCSSLVLVRPYNGELDRFSKKTQVEAETFPAEVNLTSPFALVVSKDRSRLENQGNSLKFKHDFSIYLGALNTFDFGSQELPPVFAVMKEVLDALEGQVLVHGASDLRVESDGQYLTTTNLYTIYEQRYYQYEISR